MNIVRNDRVVLTKEVGNLKTVGETYEVANITENMVILRGVVNKVAVGAVNIDEFDQYFKKSDEIKNGWTDWNRLADQNGNIVGFYRTNYKKVQVRTNDNFRAEATCYKDDEFNLFFGLQLASVRCSTKALKKMEEEYETKLKEVRSAMVENKNYIKKLLRSLDKAGE
jgi:hypothetical protein